MMTPQAFDQALQMSDLESKKTKFCGQIESFTTVGGKREFGCPSISILGFNAASHSVTSHCCHSPTAEHTNQTER